MPDETQDEDLLYFAQRAAESQFRLAVLTDSGLRPDNPVVRREERILAGRKKRLGLLVEAGRITDGLPTRDRLLAHLGQLSDLESAEEAMCAMTVAVLMEAIEEPEKVP